MSSMKAGTMSVLLIATSFMTSRALIYKEAQKCFLENCLWIIRLQYIRDTRRRKINDKLPVSQGARYCNDTALHSFSAFYFRKHRFTHYFKQASQ